MSLYTLKTIFYPTLLTILKRLETHIQPLDKETKNMIYKHKDDFIKSLKRDGLLHF